MKKRRRIGAAAWKRLLISSGAVFRQAVGAFRFSAADSELILDTVLPQDRVDGGHRQIIFGGDAAADVDCFPICCGIVF